MKTDGKGKQFFRTKPEKPRQEEYQLEFNRMITYYTTVFSGLHHHIGLQQPMVDLSKDRHSAAPWLLGKMKKRNTSYSIYHNENRRH